MTQSFFRKTYFRTLFSVTFSWAVPTGLLLSLTAFLPFSVIQPARAGTTLNVSQINGDAVIGGSGQTLAQLVSTIQQNTNSISSASSAASSAYDLALGAVQSSLIGVSGGLAVLDSSGNLTSPLSTSVSAATDYSTVGWNTALTWTTNSGTGTQAANPKAAFNHRWTMGYDSSGNPYVDDYMPPTHLRLGGSQEFDGVPLFVHNVPYGPGNMGIVEGVFLESENMRGSIAGVGPSTASGIAGYDNLDVVARYTFAGPSSPVITATGSAVTAPDGKTHIPTFSAYGATFSNPLPKAWSDWIKSHQHVRMITNELGVDPNTYKVATYMAEATGYTTDSTGLVTGMLTDGWRIANQSTNFSSVDTTKEIPGSFALDSTTPAIDTVWSNFGDPAIMFGAYTKAFDNNVICYMPGPTPAATPGDINDPTGKINNQLRSCEGIEYDLWNDDTTGETAYIRGITVAYSGTTSPSLDSYDMNLAGGNANTLMLEGEWYSMNIASHSLASAGYGGPDYTAGSKKVIVDFAQSNRPGWGADTPWPGYSHNMRLSVWNTRNQDDTNNPNDYNDITTNIGVQVDGHNDIRQLTMDGTLQEHMEFNPSAYPNGIALCGYTKCSFFVNREGSAQATDSFTIHNGKAITFTDSSDKTDGYFYANSDGNIHYTGSGPLVVDNSMAVKGSISMTAITYTTLSSLQPSLGDQRYCSDCYSSTNTAKIKGIPAWWNGTAWTDALGNTVKN